MAEADTTSSQRQAGRPRRTVWLIDGFNVLHAGGLRHQPPAADAPPSGGELGPNDAGAQSAGWWTAAQRAKVISRARSFTQPASEIWIVFDGMKPQQPEGEASNEGAVRVVFSASADEWIRRRARDADPDGSVVVVTADRRLAGQARHHGAQIVTPKAWLALCGAPRSEA